MSEADADVTVDPMVSQEEIAEIEALLADPGVPASEKRMRLEDLKAKLGDADPDAEDFAPIGMQLRHALAMLADGGHDYGTPDGDNAVSDDEAGFERPL